MRTITFLLSSLLLVLQSLSTPVFAEETPGTSPAIQDAPKSAEEIRNCARRNFPTETSIQQLVMIAHDRSGGQRTLQAKMYWRLDDDGFSNVMIKVAAPRDLSGSSYLVVEKAERDDMFMYLPAVQRVRRIVGNMKTKPLWGTDLSYEDIKQLQGVALGGSLSRLDDATKVEREMYVIQTVYEESEESAYGRVVTNIDKVTCMPLQVDFYDREENAVKMLVIKPDTLLEMDGRWQMQDLDMQDLHSKTHTEIKIEEISSDESISGRVFNSHTFYQ